ncbi:MAG TPA: hypothetical protein EYP55_00580 [Anaerolineae bacterium]|nr:hypothetical protein [Anaerolineae bacterium]
MKENLNQRLGLIQQIEQERGSRLLVYFLHDKAMIADDAVLHLYDKLEAMGWQPRLDLFLQSRGGFTEITWKIISLLWEFGDHLGVLVPYRAHSGATLIALAADEIVMGPISELSSTDPARGHYLLPKGPDGKPVNVSVQDLRRCVEFVKREAGEGADFISALFQHIHPLAIGALEQSHELVRLIARKALLTHWDEAEKGEAIERIVDTLNGRLHSHIYPLSRREAKEGLGLPVVYPSPDLWQRMWRLYLAYQGVVYTEHPVEGKEGAVRRILCLIETRERTTALRQTVAREKGRERVLEMRWETMARA